MLCTLTLVLPSAIKQKKDEEEAVTGWSATTNRAHQGTFPATFSFHVSL